MAEAVRANETEKHCGFNKRWFVKREKAWEFRCNICDEILDNPHQVICCGQQFCKLCLPAELKKCPNCKETIKENQVFPDKSVWQKVLSLAIKCPSKSCSWKGSLKDFQEEHKKKCLFVLVICTRKACHEQFPKDHLQKHVEEECLYRPKKCGFCSETIVLAAEEKHMESECLRIPVGCPQKCRDKIPREEMQKHIDNKCEMTIVACKYKDVGCTFEVKRSEMANHERFAMQDHLGLAMTAINDLSKERRNMAKEIDQLKNENTGLHNDLANLTEDQQSRITEIEERIKKIEQEGVLRIEAVQKGTEQNFDNVEKLVIQNGQFQEILLQIQNNTANIRSSEIAPLVGLCLSNQTSIQGLKTEDDMLRKMVRWVLLRQNKADEALKKEMDEKVYQLSQKHENDYKEATEFRETATEKLVCIDEAMEQNKKELAKQTTALHVMKDDCSEQFRNVAKQMERDYERLADMISKEEKVRRGHLEKLDQDVAQLQVNRVNFGRFLWKIDNVDVALQMATVDPRKATYGQPFYSEPFGYLIRPKLLLNGSRQKDRAHVSVFLQLLKGPYDGVLQWPFRQRLRFTLIDQQQNPRLPQHIQKDLLPDADSEELQRPTEAANNGFGIYKFVKHDVLRSGNYIVDDTMFVRVDVYPNDGNDLHSETI